MTEFEKSVLEILDFTATAVLKNQKMPKFERLEQLSKEWAVGLLKTARKQIASEINPEAMTYKEWMRRKNEPFFWPANTERAFYKQGIIDTLRAIKEE